MRKLRLLQVFAEADKAWMAEVIALFGVREAGLARFEGRATGQKGTRLRALYNAYARARAAYEAQ